MFTLVFQQIMSSEACGQNVNFSIDVQERSSGEPTMPLCPTQTMRLEGDGWIVAIDVSNSCIRTEQ